MCNRGKNIVMNPIYNPYLPSWEFVPDGEPHIFNDRLYIYGSHDRYGGDNYCEAHYTVWSAPLEDLSDWTCHGMSYDAKDDPHNETKKRRMFAPDVVENKGKYYLYYGLDDSKYISVASADCPEGPFTYYGTVHYPDGTEWSDREGDTNCFDPGVFKDDDGKIYLYSGFSFTQEVAKRIQAKMKAEGIKEELAINTKGSMVAELEEDMLTIKGNPKPLLPGESNAPGTGFEGHEFFEASSMRKFDGWYYAIYSSSNGHELCYAMSRYPDRGFEYKGVLHSNGNLGVSEEPQFDYGNNHGSIEKIGNDFYVFGHRHTKDTQYQRQGVAERLYRNPDGTFDQAIMTSQGLYGKPLPTTQSYPAYITCYLVGPNGAGRQDEKFKDLSRPQILLENKMGYVSCFAKGTQVGYRYFEMQQDTYIGVKVRANQKSKLYIKATPTAEPFASIQIQASPIPVVFWADQPYSKSKAEVYFETAEDGKLDLFEIVFEAKN